MIEKENSWKEVLFVFQATKRHLSSRIDRVDCNLDECAELTAATREEVGQIKGLLGI